MPTLPNSAKEAIKAIKDAAKTKIEGLGVEAGKVYNYWRYAGDLNAWLEIAAIEVPAGQLGAGQDRLRCVFIYLQRPTTAPAECRRVQITAEIAIEVIQGFFDGEEGDNSTLAFENTTGDLIELFKDDESLGFTDVSGNMVINGLLQGTEGDGRPELVDGILAHRRIFTLPVTFRIG